MPDLAGALPPPPALLSASVVDALAVQALNDRLAFYALPAGGGSAAKRARLTHFLCNV